MDWRKHSFREYYSAHCSAESGLPRYCPADLWAMYTGNAKHYDLKDSVACAVNRLGILKLEPNAYNVNKQTDHLRPDTCSPVRWKNILRLVMRAGMPQPL
jgi:hypothetical protein